MEMYDKKPILESIEKVFTGTKATQKKMITIQIPPSIDEKIKREKLLCGKLMN